MFLYETFATLAFHLTEKITNDEGREIPLVEILANGQQALCPGSLHPSGSRYSIINDASIASISSNEVYALLKGLKVNGEIVGEAEEIRREQIPDSIKLAGDNILRRGKILKFLLQQYHKNHVHDDTTGKVYFLSYVSGSSLTSSGIQPGITGDAQTGKSNSMEAALHCLPPTWVMKTGLSDKAAAYIKFIPGQVVYSDDLTWTPGLIYMLKESMSNFQAGFTYTSVMREKGKFEAIPLTIPPRMLWWLTSAEGAPDDQIETRQYPVDVQISQEHSEAVRDGIFERRSSRKKKMAEDRGIVIARYILDQIRQHGPFNVEIPFSKWIDYKIAQDYRGQQQFLDLIDALTVLNFKQRKAIDGWLQAELEDYREALQIFNSGNKSHITGLTQAELQVVACMISRPDWTQAALSEALGKSQTVISRRLDAIMGKSSYVTYTRMGAEKIYKLNPDVDLRIFGNIIVKLKPLPTKPVMLCGVM